MSLIGRFNPSHLLRLFALAAILHQPAQASVPLHRTRTSPSDLEVGGDLNGLPSAQTRFVRYADLLRLPQRRFLATGDTNFMHPVHITGIPLEQLPGLLGAAPDAHMVTALCDDRYKANYPAAYLQAHHPILVLRIEDQPPARWPRSEEGSSMGPYMISHASFTPSFRVLAHTDEPQIPWGVVRLDIRRESAVYTGIQPIGPRLADTAIQQGFAIARQNCFRCHNERGEGGLKANRSWEVVARRSVADPQFFDSYVRKPTLLNPASQMAASPAYDAATLATLRAYFRPFARPRND